MILRAWKGRPPSREETLLSSREIHRKGPAIGEARARALGARRRLDRGIGGGGGAVRLAGRPGPPAGHGVAAHSNHLLLRRDRRPSRRDPLADRQLRQCELPPP